MQYHNIENNDDNHPILEDCLIPKALCYFNKIIYHALQIFLC